MVPAISDGLGGGLQPCRRLNDVRHEVGINAWNIVQSSQSSLFFLSYMIDDSMQITFSKNQEVYRKLKPIIAKVRTYWKSKEENSLRTRKFVACMEHDFESLMKLSRYLQSRNMDKINCRKWHHIKCFSILLAQGSLSPVVWSPKYKTMKDFNQTVRKRQSDPDICKEENCDWYNTQ